MVERTVHNYSSSYGSKLRLKKLERRNFNVHFMVAQMGTFYFLLLKPIIYQTRLLHFCCLRLNVIAMVLWFYVHIKIDN